MSKIILTAANELLMQYRHPNSLDSKLIRVVGENMLDVFRGKTTILEHMLKDDVLNRFYVEALGFPEFNHCLSRTVGQLYHRYPNMEILEIGERNYLYSNSNLLTIPRCGNWRRHETYAEVPRKYCLLIYLYRYL